MAQFTIYRNTDPSAPVCNGVSGSLLTLLDACLVNGYGAKVAAGWTIEFTDTYKRVYRPATGNRLYFRFEDGPPGTARETRFRGYETMSDVDTGTGPFPTVAQLTDGAYVRKSATVDAVARDWCLIADDRTCYFFVATTDTANCWYAAGFGEFYSLLSSDVYNSFVCGRILNNDATPNAGRLDYVRTDTATVTNFFVARSISQVGTSLDCDRHGDSAYGRNGWLAGTLIYPNIDGSVLASRIWITEPVTSGIRGFLRGMWHFPHAGNSVANNAPASGINELSGRSFLFLNNTEQGAAMSSYGVYMMETSNTVETN